MLLSTALTHTTRTTRTTHDSYWTNFAKSGNPNAPVAVQPSWPLDSQAADQSMELAVPPTVKTGVRAAYCDFWDNLGYSFGN